MPVRQQDIEKASNTPQQRAQLRAQAIAESDNKPTFTIGNYRISVVDGPTLSGSAVTIVVQVTHVPTGAAVLLGDANPFVFVNPPTKAQTGTDQQGNPIYSFAPKQALAQIVADAVNSALVKAGWPPLSP